MPLSRSVMIVGPQPRQTRINTRNHAWCRPEVGQPCSWGTVIMDDPGDKGYDEPYRQGGTDVGYMMMARSIGPPTRNENECSPSVHPWYPFCEDLTYDIFVVKGALPHHHPGDYGYLNQGHYSFTGDILCEVAMDGGSYWLYRDKSLENEGYHCTPGGHFTLRLHSDLESKQHVYKPEDSYGFDGTEIEVPVTSGTTRLEFHPYWQTTGSGIGFYKDSSYMEAGGFLRIGPNSEGDIDIVRITDIVAYNIVDTTEILHDYDPGDNIYYWRSGIKPSNYMPIEEGNNPDPDGMSDGPKETQTLVETKGGLDTSAIIETFIPIPWAIPAPYSIRNVPHTNIWLRLDDPSIPFNLNTLEFKVNGENVTDDVDVTQFTGGMELLYDPPVNFDMSSRVYVEINVSCSPSLYVYFGEAALVESEFITVSGDMSFFQPGASLKLGPNPVGDWEMNEIYYIEGDQIKLATKTEYEYVQGDLISYTYDDYPVELSYYFDIVDDFKPPYFENIYPYDGMENVARNHWIMFDIKDEGLGVDISTLSFTVDNMIVIPQIYKYNDHWYRVIYTPPVPYYYNARVSCFATVQDNSSRKNRAFATWGFNTESGELPILMNPNPYFCAFPVHHKSHVGVDLFAREAGANLHSMIFTWDQKEYKVITYPKIYRQS